MVSDDEIKRKKEYLSDAYYLARGIQFKRKRILHLREIAGSPPSSGKGDKVVSTPQQSRMENCIALIDELEREIDEDIRQLREYKAAIYSVEEAKYRNLLILRYMDGYTWEKISKKLHYSSTTVDRIHKEALGLIKDGVLWGIET